ncbi:hypothetical protein ACE6H2_012002 [Prunus campanulata]
MDLSNSFGERMFVPEEDDMKKIIAPLRTEIEFLHEMVDMVVTDFGDFYDINTLNLDDHKKKKTTAPTSVQKIPSCSCVIM